MRKTGRAQLHKGMRAAIGVLVCVALLVGMMPTKVHAAETDAMDLLPGVKFSQINKDAVPNGMMLVGAFLIYDQYMTDTIYDLAVNSMTTYNQQVIYYKSSMADGQWIDMMGAMGLKDLTGRSGSTVPESELADLKICAIVYSDGTMAALTSTGAYRDPVSVFSIQDPYDLMNLQEMTPIKMMYSGLGDVSKIDWDEDMTDTLDDSDDWGNAQLYEKIWTSRMLGDVMNGDVTGRRNAKSMGTAHNDTTDAADKALSRLSGAYEYYRQRGDREGMRTILEVMGQADNGRRAEVYYMLAFSGAGSVYNALSQQDYSMLMTKEQWADAYMTNNWGSDWVDNYKWKNAINSCIKDNTKNTSRDPINWQAVGNQVYDKYRAMGYTVGDPGHGEAAIRDYVNSKKITGFRKLIFSASLTPGVHHTGGWEIDSIITHVNLISKDGEWYTIAYLAEDYAWALNQAANMIDDIKTNASQGNVDRAYVTYLSMNQNVNAVRANATKTATSYVDAGSGRLNALLLRLESGDDLSGDIKQNYSMDSDYAGAVKDAMQSCEESYFTYTNRMVGMDTTLLGSMRYDDIRYLINSAEVGINGTTVSSEYQAKIAEYTHLRNLQNDIIANKSAELSLLNNTLLPKAEERYLGKLTAGPSQAYVDSVNAGEDEELQLGHLDEQKQELNGYLSEYENLITARVKRLPLGDRVPYIEQMIVKAEGYRASIPTGAFSVKANSSVDELVDFLSNLKNTALSGSTGDSELDALESQREALNEAYLDAVDADDFDAAASYKQQLDDLDGRIADTSDGMNLPGTAEGLADSLRQSAMKDIEDGDMSRMEDYLSALGELGATDVLDGLEAKLKDAGASKALMNTLGDAKKTAAESALNGANQSTGSGDTDASAFGLNTTGFGSMDDDAYAAYMAAIAAMFGNDFNQLSDEKQAIAMIALSRYGAENKDKTAVQLSELLLAYMLEHGNTFAFTRYKSGKDGYINFAVVDRCRKTTKLRYVHVTGKDILTSTETDTSYTFTVGEMTATKQDGTVIDLEEALQMDKDPTLDGTGLMTYPYLDEKDAEEILDLLVYTIPSTDYDCLMTKQMQEKVDKLAEALKKAV